MTRAPGLLALLILIGSTWGLTVPLSKVVVTAGYRSAGIIFWTSLIGLTFLGLSLAVRGRPVPLQAGAIRTYVFVALAGNLLPSAAFYLSAQHLPAGVIAVCLSVIPMMALPMALAVGIDRATPGRVLGLTLGLVGVLLIVLPEASLPERAMVAFIPLALIAPFFYAVEGVGLSRMGTAGLGPVQVLFGASVISCAAALPWALATDTFIDPRLPWGIAEGALLLFGLVHAFAYTGYVWIVGRAGAVFAAQVSYIVTGAGVLWSMLLLGESYSLWIWAALLAVLGGLFLVQPRAAGRDDGDLVALPIGEGNIALHEKQER
ncbi:MAG: DMT family transporter [Paracoccaceae bacterium]